MARRRSAAEWGRLIREQERSGQTATAFARARGIRPDTLKWWRWRLGQKPKVKRRTAQAAGVKLVSVQPVDDSRAVATNAPTPVWELVAPTGHELRVYDRAGLGVLKAALIAVTGGRRR